MAEHDVCGSDAVVVGELTPVSVGRATIVLTRLPDGTVKAMSGRCPHMGARMEFGCLTGRAYSDETDVHAMDRPCEIIRCPWHGFEFDLQTGDPAVPSPEARRMKLRLFDVTEKGDRVIVAV